MAADAGIGTAVVASAYHRYCWLFHERINDCSGGGFVRGAMRKTVLGRVPHAARVVLSQLPFARRLVPSREVEFGPIEQYVSQMADLRKALTDPTLGFICVHLMVPHPPFFFDRKSLGFVPPTHDPVRYDDQLVLVDRTIGEIRPTLEVAGLWDETSLVLTSDHSADHGWAGFKGSAEDRVPVVVRLKGQTRAVECAEPFEAARLFAAISGILEGRVNEPESLRAALLNRSAEVDRTTTAAPPRWSPSHAPRPRPRSPQPPPNPVLPALRAPAAQQATL